MKIKFLKFFILLALSLGLFKFASAANVPLEIINIDKAGGVGRINFAYTGLEYDIAVAVVGGTYPFKYELTAAPSGMRIDAGTGKISWSSPVAGTVNCTVRVTDAENTAVTSSWLITVSEDNNKFHFVDAKNGHSVADGGTGTLLNPWKNFDDFYFTESDTQYAGDIIYFKSGSYTLFHPVGTSNNEQGGGSDRIIFNNGNPIAYLAFPHPDLPFDYPIINLEGNGSTGKSFYLNQANNYYFDGLVFSNVWNYGLQVVNNKNFTVINCKFNSIDMNVAAVGGNQAFISYADYTSQSNNNVIMDNSFANAPANVNGIITFGVYHSVFERNFFDNMSESALLVKGSSEYDVARNNRFNNSHVGIYDAGYNGGGSLVTTGNNEYAFNYIHGSTQSPIVVSSAVSTDPIYIYRNTMDTISPVFRLTESSDGPFNIYDNIVVNESVDTAFGQEFYHNKFRFALYTVPTNGEVQTIYSTRFTFLNNLNAVAGDNVINSNGELIDRSKVGTYGWETSGGTDDLTAPSAPSNFKIW